MPFGKWSRFFHILIRKWPRFFDHILMINICRKPWFDLESRLRIGIQLAFKKFCFLCDDAHFRTNFAVHAIKAKNSECDTNFQLNIFSTNYNKNKSITISDLFCSCWLNNLIFEWDFSPSLTLRCHCRHCCCVVGYSIRKVKYVRALAKKQQSSNREW